MKKLLLILLCAMATSFCQAQEIEWQNTIGGSQYDFLYSISTTADGGCILGGESQSGISGDKTEACRGGNDYWIVKLDSLGSIQWQKTLGGSGYDYLYSVKQSSDNGYIAAGLSSSNISGDKTENSKGSDDYWIIKLDSLGAIKWQKTIGANSGDILTCIEPTNDAGFILGGLSYSPASGDKSENTLGVIDMWIVKVDSIGNIEWENTIGGNGDDRCFSIHQLVNGNYILIGSSDSNIGGDKTENTKGAEDYWIIKLNSLGNIIGQKVIGGNDRDFGTSIQQTNDGGFILAGSSVSSISGDKSEISFGDYDCWVIKVDSSLNILWQKTIGGSSVDWLFSVQVQTSGDFVMGSCSLSQISGNKTVGTKGGGDLWVAQLDNTGNIKSQFDFGGVADDYGYLGTCPFNLIGNKFIIGGYSSSNQSGDKSENSRGYADYWIVKGTIEDNLVTGKLFSDLNSNQIQDSSEFTITNKMVRESNTGAITFSQQNGIYYLQLNDSGNFSIIPPLLNYYNSIPGLYNVPFTGMGQIDSLNDFAFQPQGVFNDICVTILQVGPFRAGLNANYVITCENSGTTTITPTLIFFPDNNLSFVSSIPVATSFSTDSVIWNLAPLLPFQTQNIAITVNVSSGLAIGDLISSSTRVEPLINDTNPNCNWDECSSHVTSAMDPNAILVNEDTLTTVQILSPPFLDYIIYFQNTGNDTAFNVQVLNNITLNLEINTFEFVASSHSMNITYGANARLMTFNFDNILLPDSGTNEPASHGFVHYRIKPKTTLLAGDSVTNNAYIYFDFNNPVATNTAVTKIVLPTGLAQEAVSSRQLVVYPNPAKDEITIQLNYANYLNQPIKVFDVYGKQIFSTRTTTSNIKLQTSNYPQGVYFVQVGELRAKFVKQ